MSEESAPAESHLVSISSDVLEALLESEQRLHAALRAGNVGIWEWDILSGAIIWSEVTERLYGLEPGTFKGTFDHYKEQIHPEDRETCINAIVSAMVERIDVSQEYRVQLHDGSVRWLQGRGKVVYDSATEPVRMVGTVTDITDRKDRERAESELRQAHRKLASHIENSPLAVIEWDPELRVQYWSPGAEQLFGWSEDEVRGRAIEDWHFVHEEDIHHIQEMAARLFLPDQPRRVVSNRNYTKTGSVVDCEWYNSALTDEAGNPISVLSLVLDVTARKRIEAQFLHAQKMEGLGRLAGGIAHDYNNLLAVILGFAELIEEGLDEESELLASVHNIQGAANRAAALTRQLLAFARRQVSQPRVMSPTEPLIRSTKMLRPLLGADIEPVLLMDQEVGNIRVDPTHLEQVLMNLAINARDAMPNGGKLIIRVQNTEVTGLNDTGESELPAGKYVLLRVTDTGTGMTNEVKSQLFEPFFTTKASGQGTGLGLATCYGILKQVGGDITVTTEMGAGTTFNVYFPLIESSADEHESERSAAPLKGTETVLLVEDEPLVRELSAKALRRHGYTVLEAETGVAAMEMIASRGKEIDLIVTDAVMPLMGGKELIQRAAELWPGIKFILASGYIESGAAFQPELPGEVKFVHKPFSSSMLLQAVREVLNEPK
jgi:two-component system cell cycle sensor histidine kinase/response regulator CckA